MPFEAAAIERSSNGELVRGAILRTCSAEDLIVHSMRRRGPPRIRTAPPMRSTAPSGYHTSFSGRGGELTTLSNVPQDLTMQEAERLGAFIKILATG